MAKPPHARDSSQHDAISERVRELAHPLDPVIQALRKLLRDSFPDLTEGWKWNAPSYSRAGHDRLTFQLRAKERVRLIFHCGAKKAAERKPGHLIEDPHSLLEWPADDRAIATFASLADVKRDRAALLELVRAWLAASGARD